MGSVARAQDARSIGGTVHTIDGTRLAEAVIAPLGGPARSSVTTASAGRFRLRVSLYHQKARVRLETRVLGALAEQRYSGWVKHDLCLGPRIRLDLGIRGDAFRFGFANRLRGSATSSPLGDGGQMAGTGKPEGQPRSGPRTGHHAVRKPGPGISLQ
jgi:hypothetical protein